MVARDVARDGVGDSCRGGIDAEGGGTAAGSVCVGGGANHPADVAAGNGFGASTDGSWGVTTGGGAGGDAEGLGTGPLPAGESEEAAFTRGDPTAVGIAAAEVGTCEGAWTTVLPGSGGDAETVPFDQQPLEAGVELTSRRSVVESGPSAPAPLKPKVTVD